VADVRIPVGAGLAVLAAGVWYLWTHEGKTHNITQPEAVVSDIGYWPYAWWCGTSRGNAYVHHYPDTVGATVLPMVLQTDDGTLSVQDSQVGRG
jgi:hypothetical protein